MLRNPIRRLIKRRLLSIRHKLTTRRRVQTQRKPVAVRHATRRWSKQVQSKPIVVRTNQRRRRQQNWRVKPKPMPVIAQPPPPPPVPSPPPPTETKQQLVDPVANIEHYSSNIVTELKRQMVPRFYDPVLTWPSLLRPIFVISMRSHRYRNLQSQLKHWHSLLTLLPATDGRKIQMDHWIKTGRLRNTTLTNGQVGCYESHVRIWKRIVEQNLPYAMVIEDDADIKYSQTTVDQLNQMLDELKQVPYWDIVYIGNIALHPFKRQVTDHLFQMSNWEGTYTYYISNKCAKRFLETVFPIHLSIDMYMAEQFIKHNLLALALRPALNWIMPNYVSDTIFGIQMT